MIREVTAYQVVCDECGGTAYDMGAVTPSAVLDSHPNLIARSATNGASRWWVVFDRKWNEYVAFSAYRSAPIVIESSRSLATVMDEVWAW